MRPETLSRELRRGRGGALARRRGIVGLSLLSAAAMGMSVLYQMGLLRHLPDPPLRRFDADRVDASGQAYAILSTPDGALGLLSYASTLVLAAMDGQDRAVRRPWIPLALLGKIGADAAYAAKLTVDQWTRHRAFCMYCLIAAGATFAMVPLAVGEAVQAWRALRGR
jgi:uncharacterized membrane protein